MHAMLAKSCRPSQPNLSYQSQVMVMPPPGRVLKGLVNSGLLKPIFAGQTRSYKRARAQINLQETPAKVKPSIREEEAKAWPDLDLGAFYSEVGIPAAPCSAPRIDTEAFIAGGHSTSPQACQPAQVRAAGCGSSSGLGCHLC